MNSPFAKSEPASYWNLGKRKLDCLRGRAGVGPLVMGILNVTPDSFSDGGKHIDLQAAVDAALSMESAGADIIDIGGESTRPYSQPVNAIEELKRVVPLIEKLRNLLQVPISIDTSKALVASAAIEAGAEIINDVTGLEGDPQMAEVAASNDVGVCVMHMQGTPQTMQDNPTYGDVVEDIFGYLEQRLNWCERNGIPADRVCLDPGIGFGKSHEHNIMLVRNIARFLELGRPILIGHSRKGFIGKLLGDKASDRDAGTLGVTLAVSVQGAHIVRVHAVKSTVDAIRLFYACGGQRNET